MPNKSLTIISLYIAAFNLAVAIAGLALSSATPPVPAHPEPVVIIVIEVQAGQLAKAPSLVEL